ncbi:hypothetical protein BDB01DRAFT_899496 [Pilobolus umbonatus]|nr:hypothetical protein BDB01DRAFT_899496 [Pilobolus umbonatus]
MHRIYLPYEQADVSAAIARQDEALRELIRSKHQVNRNPRKYFQDLKPHAYHPTGSPGHVQFSLPNSNYKTKELLKVKSPLPTAKSNKWIQRMMPSHCHGIELKKDHIYDSTDDEVALNEIKQKVRPTKQRPPLSQINHQIPRPIVIPSIKSHQGKIVVIDVPQDITVVIRSLSEASDKKDAIMHHIKDDALAERLMTNFNMDLTSVDAAALNKKKKANKGMLSPINTNVSTFYGESASSSPSKISTSTATLIPKQESVGPYNKPLSTGYQCMDSDVCTEDEKIDVVASSDESSFISHESSGFDIEDILVHNSKDMKWMR